VFTDALKLRGRAGTSLPIFGRHVPDVPDVPGWGKTLPTNLWFVHNRWAMTSDEAMKKRVGSIRKLVEGNPTSQYEAAALATAVLHDTVGGSHPLAAALRNALEKSDSTRAVAAASAVVRLYDEGRLQSPRLAIAHEIEGSLLDIADSQMKAAERASDPSQKQLQLSIAAFLAGAALEDALRRLCDSNEIDYDARRSTIAKLQGALYQPSKQVEVINGSENKQITAWGDTRNKADHGKFSELTQFEVQGMVLGVRGFIDRHLP
jgi:hypothetical protein